MAAAKSKKANKRGKATVAPSSVLGRGDLRHSLLLIFPLFLVYEVGVMFSPTVNGVDFVTRLTFAATGENRVIYLIAHLALAAVVLGGVFHLRRKRDHTKSDVLPMLLESAIYAATIGTAIVLILDNLVGMQALSQVAEEAVRDVNLGTTGEAIVAAIGAGVHEEVVFRLGVLSGVAALLRYFGAKLTVALVVGFVVSALLFSLVHHLGPLGDPFELRVFAYRALAGVAFGLVYYYRSLAHAVYSHALYDLYVMVLQS